MPTVYLAPFIGAGGQFFTNNGTPLAGGKIFTYTAGTTTPQATYTDNTGGTPQANPIVLDSSGRISGGEVWITSSLYKFVVQDSTGVTLGTYDNVGVTTTILLSATPATSTTLGTVIVPVTGGAAVDGSGNITVPGMAALTTLGDIPYVSANGTPGTVARLAGNTAATQKVLVQTGTGSVSAAPSWTSSPSFTAMTLGSGSLAPGVLLTVGTANATSGDRKVVSFLDGGFANPGTYNTSSNGDKLQIFAPGGSNYDACIGAGSSTNMWFKSVGAAGTSGSFEWWMGNATSGFIKHMTLAPGGFVLNNTGGNQETGFYAVVSSGIGGGIQSISAGINFKSVMATTPSGVTLTPTDSNIGSKSVSQVGKYGCLVNATSAGAGAYSSYGTYVTT